MPARKLYQDYYNNEPAIKKKQEYENTYEEGYYDIEKIDTRKKNRPVGKVKFEKKSKEKNKLAIMATIFAFFFMTMIITYRYNLINERNLEVIRLKSELESTEAVLANVKIEVERNTDLNEIEAYAKQQLGMQKPDKNQTVYVDTSSTIKSVKVEEDNATIINKVIDIVREFIENILYN